MALRDLFRRRAVATSAGRPPAVDPSRRLPKASGTEWVPVGATFQVAGRAIPGGMVYVGRGLAAAHRHGVEPALIDPSLKVAWNLPDWAGAGLHYWPEYRQIPPDSRAAYLTWLANGRSDTKVPVGYVFLFFYGLERRVLVDLGVDASHPEVAAVAGEVRRLRSIYGSSRSFDSYAGGFLDLLDAAAAVHAPLLAPDVGTLERGWDVPSAIRIALGRFAAAGKPIPADWALALVRTHPEAYLRTPATRCAAEFDELFAHVYRARFGDGMVIRPPKGTVTLTYRPASGGFGGEVRAELAGIPDVTRIAGPIGKLKDLAAACTDSLDAYSRFLGRNPEGRGTAAAIGFLPDELLATHGGSIVANLRSWVQGLLAGGTQVAANVDEVIGRWDPGRTAKLAKADAVAVAGLLAKLGVGIEPDVRFGGATPGPQTEVVLFPLPAGATAAPSPAYAAAAVLVHLAAVVSNADGSVTDTERRHLAEHLETTLGLDEAERVRLDARLSWLVASSKAGLAGLKRRVDELDTGQRTAIGHFLIGAAAADGQITADEITMLTKLYKLLGLDEGDVYRLIHTIETGDTGPVTVAPSGTSATRWQLPPPETDSSGLVRLDPAKVQARLADTAVVSALLSDIFTDDGEAASPTTASRPIPAARAEGADDLGGGDVELVAGLDAAHSRLARILTGRQGWSRSEAEAVAALLDLPLLDGAVDRINDAVIEVCGEPLLEGDDPLEINDYARELLV